LCGGAAHLESAVPFREKRWTAAASQLNATIASGLMSGWPRISALTRDGPASTVTTV
jgi:hypothetical protein